MKKCPYCAEKIDDEVKVCQYCGKTVIGIDQEQVITKISEEYQIKKAHKIFTIIFSIISGLLVAFTTYLLIWHLVEHDYDGKYSALIPALGLIILITLVNVYHWRVVIGINKKAKRSGLLLILSFLIFLPFACFWAWGFMWRYFS